VHAHAPCNAVGKANCQCPPDQLTHSC
jgi:hypothetical protein